jgi:hypothetical protein
VTVRVVVWSITVHTTRAVKKKLNFFLFLFIPLSPLSTVEVPRSKFFSSKKIQLVPKDTGKQRCVLSRCGEGHQSCDTLTKGLPYCSRDNGHGQESHVPNTRNTVLKETQILIVSGMRVSISLDLSTTLYTCPSIHSLSSFSP